MNWSDTTWKQIRSTYQSIIDMPFIQELMNGKLPIDKFQFYMTQDSWYLEHFGRALSVISARVVDTRDTLAFMRFAEGAIVVENALHESYFKEYNVENKGAIEPACHHYIHFLKSTAALDAPEIGMAAVLPCFWIYKKVGDYIYNNQEFENNPYQKWIDTYAGEAFGAQVQQAISICDRVAAQCTATQREQMTAAFITSSRLEFQFWDSAYHLRKW